MMVLMAWGNWFHSVGAATETGHPHAFVWSSCGN